MDDDQGQAGRLGRFAGFAAALGLGQIYALVLIVTTALAGELSIYFCVTAELFVIGVALVARWTFGWLGRCGNRSGALVFALVGVASVALGRVLASLILMAGAGAIALTKQPEGFLLFLLVVVPSSLVFAGFTLLLTLAIPEAIGLIAGVAIQSYLHGRRAGHAAL